MLEQSSGNRSLGWSALVVGASWLAACAVGSPVGGQCETGSDCESGACDKGVCVDTSGDGGEGGEGGQIGAGAQAAGGESAGGQAAGGQAEGGGSGFCSPGHDGVVSRDEVPLAAGLEAQFRVATDVTFDTAGADVGGVQTWDLSGSFAGDHTSLLETRPLAGEWFEDLFPGATYAARLSDEADVLGVFEINDDALLLRGVVSPEDGLYRTELEYDPPVVVLAFPLTEGDTFTTDATVSGLTTGVYGIFFETYESEVDARGDMITPFATFDVLRVKVDLTRTVGALVTTQKTFAFVAECFGTVATVRSQTNESGEEFNDVSELQRLTP